VQKQFQLNGVPEERAGYFPVSGVHLYTVLHEVKDPVARVLLVGPFASERHNSYLPWARWARYLAAEKIEVLRFDYRGTGESTGVFEEMTIEDWSQDLRLLSEWFAERSPHVPMLLHGLGLGAVLAGRAFEGGMGDGLLLWSPAVSANQALRVTLMRWAGLEQIFRFGVEPKSAGDYIRGLEQGVPLEVDGYNWSPRLWRDSLNFAMPAALLNEESAAEAFTRPVRIVKLTREAAPFTKVGNWGYDDLKDFTWLFDPDRRWIELAASKSNQEIAYA
jgi:predicted alpha/beta hydrolase